MRYEEDRDVVEGRVEEQGTSKWVKTEGWSTSWFGGSRLKLAARVTPRVPRKRARVTVGIPLMNSPISFDAMEGVTLKGIKREEKKKKKETA